MAFAERRFGRRAFIVGTGALVTEGLVQGCDSSPSTPTPSDPYTGAQQTVDLTVRWRHLERRVQDPTLSAAWQFDEGSGYSFDDVSGNGHTLYLTGTHWNTTDSGLAGAIHRRGVRGGAVHLNGTQWLAAASTTELAVRDGLSISCWVRLDRLPSQTATLVSLAGSYALTVDPDGSLALTVIGRSGVEHIVRTSPAALTTEGWAQVTATASPATGALHLYLDGARVSSRSAPKPFAMSSVAASLVLSRHVTGALDEVTLHNQMLDEQSVRDLYVVGLPKIYTQTSESIDPDRQVFTRFKGSDPIPHPVIESAVLTHRFGASALTEQRLAPLLAPPASSFLPGAFGGAWRATSHRLSYRSPLTGDSGTFEAWYRAVPDPGDPDRQGRKEMFTALGTSSALTLYTLARRWQVDVRRPGGRLDTLTGFAQELTPQTLEHIAVTWGEQGDDGTYGVRLFVGGIPAASLTTDAGETSYTGPVGIGGTPAAPTYCLLDDVRICETALPWGEICPRGHAFTDAAGLDLRDRFDRPPGARPLLWRPGSPGATWSHRRKTWEHPTHVGDDPASLRALFQGSRFGLHPIYHPDAFGYASSIEAGVAFPQRIDGWAGVFVQSAPPGGDFSGVTFMLNPVRSELRLARYDAGLVTASKVLRVDFPLDAATTYEITLTCAGDGIVRGFLDGSNVQSMRAPAGWPPSGFAGMLTHGSEAFFSNLHFSALTPATAASRVIRTRLVRYGEGASSRALALVPFRWHKRRGLLPWQYAGKDPEPPGNIAGADTATPPRPIRPAAWRSEDSANSDLITVNGRVLYFMRGNPSVDERAATARVGVLHADVTAFDGIHFSDPNIASRTLTAGTLLLGKGVRKPDPPGAPILVQLNAPSSAYVGEGRVLFLGREYGVTENGDYNDQRLVYSHFDTRTDSWVQGTPQPVLSLAAGSSPAGYPSVVARLHGSPEVVSLREPDHDTYQAVLFQQTGGLGNAVMATALLTNVTSGKPEAVPGTPLHKSLSRRAGGAIYGFRVLFDNGIYYLHYNDGVQVPDWPDRFVLAATLDPYAGPWVANLQTAQSGSTYFRRGRPTEPDNGAIWQGTMFKHRGRYYMYYENYHSIDDVDAQYQNYGNPQAGSRVGFATA